MGRKKRKNPPTFSPLLPGWEPEPQPYSPPARCSDQEFLAWLLPRIQRGEAELAQRQQIPVPELGWCEWCPKPRHHEDECTYSGPAFCCCCVFEDELEDVLAALHGAYSAEDSGCHVPPTPPIREHAAGPVDGPASPGPIPDPWFGPEAGPVAGPATLDPTPDPLPAPDPPHLRYSSAAGSESWWGESGEEEVGDEGGGVGPEEEPAGDGEADGAEEGPAGDGGTKGRKDARPPEPASPSAPPDSPGNGERGAGQEPSGDPATEGDASAAAAVPVATRTVGHIPTCAAASISPLPLATTQSGQPQSAPRLDDPGAPTAAAPPTVPEHGPGREDPAAATIAAEESGLKFFAGVTPAGRDGVPQFPPPTTRSAGEPSNSGQVATPPATSSPALGPAQRSTPALRRAHTEAGPLPGSLLEKGAPERDTDPPPASLASGVSAPATQSRLTFDPGGCKLRGGECDARGRVLPFPGSEEPRHRARLSSIGLISSAGHHKGRLPATHERGERQWEKAAGGERLKRRLKRVPEAPEWA